MPLDTHSTSTEIALHQRAQIARDQGLGSNAHLFELMRPVQRPADIYRRRARVVLVTICLAFAAVCAVNVLAKAPGNLRADLARYHLEAAK